MKKFALLLLSLTLCFALAACGGSDTAADEQAAADDTAASTTADESADSSATSDKQTAIDEFNATSAAFNEVANAINADPSAFERGYRQGKNSAYAAETIWRTAKD